MDFTRACRTQNVIGTYLTHLAVLIRIELHAPMKVILEFYKSNINSLSKKDKSILDQTFVYVLLSNPFIFGQTIDVSLIKL